MARNDALFRLIKSLTRAEKRYLVLQARHAQANHVRLWRAIEAQNAYDEEALKKQFAGETFIRQLHVTKNYLYRFILDHLRVFHKSKTIDTQLAEGLGNVALLFARELYEAALDELERLEPAARRHERLCTLLEILHWKKRLYIYLHGSRPARILIRSLLDDERTLLDQLVHLHAHRRQVINLPDLLTQPDALHVDDDNSAADTFMARILRLHLIYPFLMRDGRKREAEETLDRLIEMIEQEPERIRQEPDLYVTSLINKAYFLLREKRRDGFLLNLLTILRQLPDRYGAPLNTYHRIVAAGVELECRRDTLDIIPAQKLMADLKPLLDGHAEKLTLEQHQMFNYQFAYLHFMSRHFRKALPYLNTLLDTSSSAGRPDLLLYARFLNLMTHLELQNTTLLRYAVDSVRRYIRKHRPYRPHEVVLLRFFSAICNAPRTEYAYYFARMRAEVFAETSPDETAELLDYINIYAWIDEVTSFKT